MTDLGKLTGISFTVLVTPEIDNYFHRGIKSNLYINNKEYPVTVKSRYKKGKEIRVKCELQ